MEDTTQPQANNLAKALLRRTGQRYLLVCLLLAQLLLVPGLLIWVALLSVNVQLTQVQLESLIPILVGTAIAASLILAGILQYRTRIANQRLGSWARSETLTGGSLEELSAWRQITSAPWRYGFLSLVVLPLAMILPLMAYTYFAFDATSDQLVYALMGGIVVTTATASLAALLVERALAPAREVLLPRSFEAQLAGAAGLRIRRKFLVVTLTLIAVSVLLLAPIGYHTSYVILHEPLVSELVLEQLRVQTLVASGLAMLLGLILTYLISSSISTPLSELIDVFNRVGRGDLRSRARVLGTDEAGELAVHFNQMISRLEEHQAGLENQVKARTAQLEATLEVGRVASAILDPDDLMEKVTQLISDRFGYYYTAIFLLDENGAWAELKDATGEAGKILRERGHRLPIGGKSMVSAAIQTRRGKIALDVGDEATRFDNPLLPRTRSEIALPLLSGNRVLGVLDVQSVVAAAFDENDINTLQNMANQVAVSIENARLFRETEEALQEIRETNAQAFNRAWSDLARDGPLLTYEATSASALEGKGETVEVPLLLRDQKLGNITVEGSGEWTPEEKSLLGAIAGQAALALENARLINESQQSALRERLASAITERIWSSSSVEAILQTTIREVGRALEASDATIELKIEDQDV
jgi:GAF domain-containing protein/HAMP domain-containing protein